MPKFYRIKGLPGLDGLIVQNLDDQTIEVTIGKDPAITFVPVSTIITNAVVGDRDLKFPLPPRSLLIDAKFLVDIIDPTKEYSAKSPFGKHLYDGTYARGDLHIAYTVFDNALSVTVYEKKGPGKEGIQKTLYSQNFFVDHETPMRLIEDVMAGEMDPEDLVFELDHCRKAEQG